MVAAVGESKSLPALSFYCSSTQFGRLAAAAHNVAEMQCFFDPQPSTSAGNCQSGSVKMTVWICATAKDCTTITRFTYFSFRFPTKVAENVYLVWEEKTNWFEICASKLSS